MAMTRQELIFEFLIALTSGGTIEFNKESIDRAMALAEALADRYLASLLLKRIFGKRFSEGSGRSSTVSVAAWTVLKMA